MPYETLALHTDEQGIATLTLNRPDSRNALNSAMCRELVQAMEDIDRSPDIRMVLLRGAGTAFCAGADLKERQGMSTGDLTARRVAGFTAYDAIEKQSKPIVAVVHGAAFGSGCEIVGACDFAVATPKASFRYPEVGWGTVGATQRIPRIAGVRIAKELLFTGRVFDAGEAREFGLVNRVVSEAELEAVVAALCAPIAKANPLTLTLTKQAINDGVETTREGAMAVELLAIGKNLRGSDWQAAIAGFSQRGKEE